MNEQKKMITGNYSFSFNHLFWVIKAQAKDIKSDRVREWEKEGKEKWVRSLFYDFIECFSASDT